MSLARSHLAMSSKLVSCSPLHLEILSSLDFVGINIVGYDDQINTDCRQLRNHRVVDNFLWYVQVQFPDGKARRNTNGISS